MLYDMLSQMSSYSLLRVCASRLPGVRQPCEGFHAPGREGICLLEIAQKILPILGMVMSCEKSEASSDERLP